MKIELTAISSKKFLLITLLSVPIISLLSIGIAVLLESHFFVFLIIPLIGLSIYLGQKFSKIKTEIVLDEDEIKINHEGIKYSSVIGYFINDAGLTQKALLLRVDTNKTINIVSSSVGEIGIRFNEMLKEVTTMIKIKNPQVRKLEYQDFYEKQIKVLKPFLYTTFGVVLAINIVIGYLIVTNSIQLPWQIFYLNFLLLGLLPFIKKKDK